MNNNVFTVHSQTSSIVNPVRRLVAGISQGIRVVVRHIPTLAVESVFTALDNIERLRWSADGSFLIAVVSSQAVLHVWSVDDPEWVCRIDAGLTGISDARGHPRIPSIVLVYSEFNLKVDVWNLRSEARTSLRDVKANFEMVVSNGGRHALMLTSRSGQDTVHILDLETRNVELHFSIIHSVPLSSRADIAGVCWTYCDDGIIAWESALYSWVYQYDLAGRLLKRLNLFEGEDAPPQLGIRTVVHSNSVVAFGCFDNKLRLYSVKNALALLAVFSLQSNQVIVTDGSPVVFRVTLGGAATARDRNVYSLGGGNVNGFPVEYKEIIPDDSTISDLGMVELPNTHPVSPPTHLAGKAAIAIGPPAGGISTMRLSQDGLYLAVVSDLRPSVVYVYDILKVALIALLVHRLPVRDFQWSPVELAKRNRLAIVTGDANLFTWTPTNDSRAFALKDTSFKPVLVSWGHDGKHVIVSEADRIGCIGISVEVGHTGG